MPFGYGAEWTYIPIGYEALKANLSRNVLFMYIGFASRTLMSKNHSWKPSADTKVIPGGKAPWIYAYILVSLKLRK